MTKKLSVLMSAAAAIPLIVGLSAAPEAMAVSPVFGTPASEGVKNYCAAPDAKEELKKLAEGHGNRNRYAADLAFNRMACAQLQVAALAEEADADTAAAAVDAISSITREETDQAILETAVEELKNLALEYESVSYSAVLGIRHRLVPVKKALNNDQLVRRRAVSSIGEIGYQYENLRSRIVQDLLFMAHDKSPTVRESVATHLGRFVVAHKVAEYLHDDVLYTLKSLAQDESEFVKGTAGMYLTPASPTPQP